ncbi:MAG: DUF192 domain-containing protein [Gemmatimonadetes bacterium]|nr:DUF192 domain-containing protein [Gemmatimonadota bacterium]MBT8478622.1 DUF192 domain-containing protein [Gemmatimonadota bacterium]
MIAGLTPARFSIRRIGTRLALSSALLAIPLVAGCGEAGGTAAGGSSTQEQTGQPVPAGGGQGVRTTPIRIGGVAVTAEIADNADLRGQGLMNRDSLPENHGMLFVYGTSEVRSFWMRNTRIPLDIAFIDASGVIINVEQMEPQSDQNYYSQGPMMYALEMDRGWFEANGVGPGDRLEF